MKKFYYFLILIALITPCFSAASSVYKISFTTEERSVKPGELSSAITIQTQDSSGSLVQTPETLDLEFESSSPTGEFLGSSGNPATKTMSKNTSNRTFYYKDSSAGTFLIKVTATGRDTGEVWSVEQNIIVSDSATDQNDGNGEVLSASTENSLSSTSGSSQPKNGTVSALLEVYAGPNRLTAPGSPINFQAQVKKNGSANQSLKFYWSFGDGHVANGEIVSHTYKYPGEYAVVLNAKSGNVFATSRLKVLVSKPEIIIEDNDDYLLIKNNSNSEVNLFNWKIVFNGFGFVFQPDTIVLAKSSIMLDKSLLKMKGEAEQGLLLKNFSGDVVFRSMGKPNKDEILKMNADLASAQIKVNEILGLVQKKEVVATSDYAEKITSPDISIQDEAHDTYPTDENSILFESEKNDSLFNKLTNLVKRVFYK